MAWHADRGDEVAVVFMTDGVGARGGDGIDESASRRAEASRRALEILGCQKSHSLTFPDNALDTVPLIEVTRGLETFCGEWGMPDRVYTHHSGDLNVDHRVVHAAVMTTFRPQPGRGGPHTILSFEVASSTGWFGAAREGAFVPTYFKAINLEKKLAALREYQEEMRDWPHARSLEAVEAMARFRGASVGLEAAEAFVVERIIETHI
jgi:LmbE family N-acetylglucosaminyl deacetylase